MTTSDFIMQDQRSTHNIMLSKLGKLAYVVVILSALVLAVTGIGTFAAGKAPMTEYVLMLHVGITPVFALALAFMALTWAGAARYDGGAAGPGVVAKTLFWLILLSGLVVILSGVVPMTPLFGTEGQHQLYLTHRYSGIVLAVALVLHALSWRRRKA